MAKKTKPRWGFTGIVDACPYPLTEDDIQGIGDDIGISFENKCATELMEASRSYMSNKEILDHLPRPSEVKAALEAVCNKANDFLQILEELDFKTRYILGSSSDWVDIEGAKHQVEMILSAAKSALNEAPSDRGGRPKHRALNLFILKLAKIYEEATASKATITWHEHRERYEGHFYDFVYACLQKIDTESIWSNSSLGQQIKGALRHGCPSDVFRVKT